MDEEPLNILKPRPLPFSIPEERDQDERQLDLFLPQIHTSSIHEVHDEDEKPLPFEMFQPQPQTPPKSTGSFSSMLLQPGYKPPPRNRSPYARPHLRTQSSPLSAPPMMRAHSSPTFNSPQLVLSLPVTARSSSPLRSPKRARSPFRSSSDELYPPTFLEPDIESIHEDEPLDITPRASDSRLTLEPSPILNPQYSNTFPRSRRRPASPLCQMSSLTSTPTSASSSGSPLLNAARFNEAFPSDLPYHRTTSLTSSSVPSTPTSARSRSPSISSLETIPDSPDAEEAAIEADKLERLRSTGSDGFRRGSLETIGSRNGGGFGSRDKRKRWSVCGAEKRSDLNLETIWED